MISEYRNSGNSKYLKELKRRFQKMKQLSIQKHGWYKYDIELFKAHGLWRGQ